MYYQYSFKTICYLSYTILKYLIVFYQILYTQRVSLKIVASFISWISRLPRCYMNSILGIFQQPFLSKFKEYPIFHFLVKPELIYFQNTSWRSICNLTFLFTVESNCRNVSDGISRKQRNSRNYKLAQRQSQNWLDSNWLDLSWPDSTSPDLSSPDLT